MQLYNLLLVCSHTAKPPTFKHALTLSLPLSRGLARSRQRAYLQPPARRAQVQKAPYFRHHPATRGFGRTHASQPDSEHADELLASDLDMKDQTRARDPVGCELGARERCDRGAERAGGCLS